MWRQVFFGLLLGCAILAIYVFNPFNKQVADPDVLTVMKQKLKPGDKIIQPENSDWKEPVKLADLDGDQQKEGIGLIKFADGRLGVWVLKKVGLEWQWILDVRKKAQSIEHAFVGDYDGDKLPDLLIGWVFSEEKRDFDKTLGDILLDLKVDKNAEIFRIRGNKVEKAAQMKYYLMQTDDFDQDGVAEIIELHKVPDPPPEPWEYPDGIDPNLPPLDISVCFNIHLYKLKGNKLVKVDERDYPMATGLNASLIQFDKGKLNRKLAAVFLVYHGDGNLITNKEMYTVKQGQIQSVFNKLKPELEVYSSNMDPFRDVDHDGFMDIPAMADGNIEGLLNLPNVYHRTFINWYHMTENREFVLVAQQYEGDHFLFNFPKRWFNKVGIDYRDEKPNNQVDDETVFDYVEGKDVYKIILREKTSRKPLIRIGRVTISEWEQKEAELKKRKLRYEVLFDETGQVYYAVLPDQDEVNRYPALKELNLEPGEAKKNFIFKP